MRPPTEDENRQISDYLLGLTDAEQKALSVGIAMGKGMDPDHVCLIIRPEVSAKITKQNGGPRRVYP